MTRWTRTTAGLIHSFANLFLKICYFAKEFLFHSHLTVYYFLTLRVMLKNVQYTEPVFVNFLRSPGIDSQPDGPVRPNPRNRFLVSLNVYKDRLWYYRIPQYKRQTVSK
jgi:hypothetical protein